MESPYRSCKLTKSVFRGKQSRFFNYDTFFGQAANGTLPAFSWVAPAANMSDHPCVVYMGCPRTRWP